MFALLSYTTIAVSDALISYGLEVLESEPVTGVERTGRATITIEIEHLAIVNIGCEDFAGPEFEGFARSCHSLLVEAVRQRAQR